MVLTDPGKVALQRRWRSQAPDPKDVRRHLEEGRGRIGLIPTSLSLVAVDVDKDLLLAPALGLLGKPLFDNASLTPGRRHLWYRSSAPPPWTTWPGGEVRSNKGYIVLYDAPGLAASLSSDVKGDILPRLDMLKDRAALMQHAPKGQRNNVLNLLDFTARLDFDEAEGLGTAAVKAGLPVAEVAATMSSVKDAADRNASVTLDDGAIGLTTAMGLLGFEYRANARTRDLELRHHDAASVEGTTINQIFGLSLQPDGWAALQDGAHALREVLRRRFKNQRGNPYKPSDADFTGAMAAMLTPTTTRVDPFVSWLEALDDHDGRPRLGTLLHEALGVSLNDLHAEVGKRFMVAAIKRAYEPGCEHEWEPMLVGGQGYGKTSFVMGLFPSGYRWTAQVGSLEQGTQRQAEAIGTAVVVEFSEITIKDAALVKSYLSDREDRYRVPYAKVASANPRRWVGILTSNDGILRDPSGNRRFVGMEVNPPGATMEARARHVRRYMEKNRIQLWAEALVLYREGYSWHIPGRLEAAQKEANAMFESTDQRMEIPALELTQTHAVAGGQEPVGITLKDLLIEVGIEDAHSNGSRLGKELRRLDWHKRRVLKDKVQRTLWVPPRRTVEACARCQGVLDSHGDCQTCEMDRPIETRRALNFDQGAKPGPEADPGVAGGGGDGVSGKGEVGAQIRLGLRYRLSERIRQSPEAYAEFGNDTAEAAARPRYRGAVREPAAAAVRQQDQEDC